MCTSKDVGYFDIGLVMDIDTCLTGCSRIFTGSFAVIPGLICTFHTKVYSSLRDQERLLSHPYNSYNNQQEVKRHSLGHGKLVFN